MIIASKDEHASGIARRTPPAPFFAKLAMDPLRHHAPALLFIAIAVLAIYWWGVWHPSLGPELALFYSVAHDKTFSQVMHEYVNFGSILWFRPTAFYLPYWIGERFLDWHNTTGWKLYQVAVLIPACWAVYLLAQLFFPQQRLAGIIAALYLAIYPGCISVVQQSAAFDATHIFFVILTVLLFCSALLYEGTKAVALTALAWLSFVAALTSKELTIVTPVFLACVVLITRRRPLALVPFFALLPLYYYLRFLQMPAYERAADYRTLFNADIVFENALKYPFWVMRLFGIAPDPSNQSMGHVHTLNLAIGFVLLAAVCLYWIPRAMRDSEMRRKGLLLVLWIAVFVSVPVYSGRYLWHIDLAVCGYALLVGIAIAHWISTRRMRNVTAVVALAALIAAGIASSRDNMLRGVYSVAFRVGTKLLHSPPAPPSQMDANALIIIEDRLNLSPWTYGGQALFRYIYRRPVLTERAVPSIDKVSREARAEWLAHPHAYFFRYDDEFNWYDDSAAFRAQSTKMK